MAGIKEIARLAGVSIGTVDRVLHNRGRCSESTREKVLLIAEKLEYNPDFLARRLKLKTPCRIAICHPFPLQDQGYWKFADEGLVRAQREFGSFGVVIELIPFDKFNTKSFCSAAEYICNNNFQGLLLAPVLPDEANKLLSRVPLLPFVSFDSPFEHRSQLRGIYQDGYSGGKTVATAFTWNHSVNDKLAVIAYESANPNIELRVKGFTDELVQNGYPAPDYFFIPDELSYDELLAFLDSEKIDLTVYNGIFIAKTGVAKYSKMLNTGIKKTFIIGYDLVDDNVSELKNRRIDALISQGSTGQVYEGLKTLVHHNLYGQKFDDTPLITTVDILTRNNIDIYIDKRMF